MIVYRVRNGSGDGPYNGGKLGFALNHDPWSATHPSGPIDIQVTFRPYSWNVFVLRGLPWRTVFGFASVEQLMTWFDGCEKILDDAGYSIVRFEVPDNHVICTRHQAAFHEHWAVPA